MQDFCRKELMTSKCRCCFLQILVLLGQTGRLLLNGSDTEKCSGHMREPSIHVKFRIKI